MKHRGTSKTAATAPKALTRRDSGGNESASASAGAGAGGSASEGENGIANAAGVRALTDADRQNRPNWPNRTERVGCDSDAAKAHLDDATLVALARDGDHDAYRILAERCSGAVTALAYAVTSDREAARDVAQEVLIEGYRRLATLRDPARFGAWVCGIARRRAIYYLRQRKRSRLVFNEPLDSNASASTPTPSEHLERDERRQQVLKALGQIGEKYRVVLILKYVDEMSYAKIAKLMSISLATVDKRLTRAKAMLRKLLKDV